MKGDLSVLIYVEMTRDEADELKKEIEIALSKGKSPQLLELLKVLEQFNIKDE